MKDHLPGTSRNQAQPVYGIVRTADDLGRLTRAQRKHQGVTLEELSGVTGLGIRFLSEFERGKPTAEIGKVLQAINMAGLEVVVVPRRLVPEINRLLKEDSDAGS